MSKATLKFIRLSPTKARLIAREVQGMNAELALASLEFMPNKAAGVIAKVIASAVANGDYEPEEVEVISCRVDKGPALRRFRPRARGSASRIMKPTSHIMVEVGTVSGKAEAPKKAEVKKEAPKKAEKTEAASDEIKIKRAAKDIEDLAALSGVGPKLVEKLNAEGITTLQQVADLDSDAIVALDEKLGVKGKIEDTWKAEAAALIEKLEKES